VKRETARDRRATKKTLAIGLLLFIVAGAGGALFWRESGRRPRVALDGARLLSAEELEERRAKSGLFVTPRAWPGVERLVMLESQSIPKPPASPLLGAKPRSGYMEVVIRPDAFAQFLASLTTDRLGRTRCAGPEDVTQGSTAAPMPKWAAKVDLQTLPPVVGAFLRATVRKEAPLDAPPRILLHISFHVYGAGESLQSMPVYAYVRGEAEQARQVRILRVHERWHRSVECTEEEWRKTPWLEQVKMVTKALGVETLIENAEVIPQRELRRHAPRRLPAPATWQSREADTQRVLLGTRALSFDHALFSCWEIAEKTAPRWRATEEPITVQRYLVCPGLGAGFASLLSWTCWPPAERGQALWDSRDILFHGMPSEGGKKIHCARLICVPADKALWYAGDEPDAAWKAWKLGPPEADPTLIQ